MLIVNDDIQIPLSEFEYTYARSSGPGGQNVNKVNTKATMHWNVRDTEHLSDDVRARFMTKNRRRINNDGQIVIHSQRYRDQQRNATDCLDKLRDLIAAAAVAPVKRKKTKPSKASKRRRLEDKRRKGQKKDSRKPPKFDG